MLTLLRAFSERLLFNSQNLHFIYKDVYTRTNMARDNGVFFGSPVKHQRQRVLKSLSLGGSRSGSGLNPSRGIPSCAPSCTCSLDGLNRTVLGGVRVKLEVFHTQARGWGVRASEFLAKGVFVALYAGELSWQKNGAEEESKHFCIHFTDRKNAARDSHLVLDAQRVGNVTRFINNASSKDEANMRTVNVQLPVSQWPLPAFFTSRPVLAGEELLWCYEDNGDIY